MRRKERFRNRIMGADGVVRFLKSFFRERADGGGEKGMRKYFATWPPYRMRKLHVEFIGKKEIYRPDAIPDGVDGTMEMYHFAGGANTPKYDAQTRMEGLEDDERRAPYLPGAEKGGRGRLTREEKNRLAGLGEVKVMEDTGKRRDVGANKPVSGEETVVARKVKRKYRLRTRRLLPSCGRGLGGRKSPHLLPVSGGGLVFRCSLILVFMVRSCGGGQRVL